MVRGKVGAQIPRIYETWFQDEGCVVLLSAGDRSHINKLSQTVSSADLALLSCLYIVFSPFHMLLFMKFLDEIHEKRVFHLHYVGLLSLLLIQSVFQAFLHG